MRRISCLFLCLLPSQSISLCNSHIQSLKLNYLSLISICAFLVTASAIPSTTKPLIHTSFCTTIHQIPATAKRASHTASFYAFYASVLTDFLDETQEMASFFERRDYSAQSLKHDLEKMKHLSQSNALSKSNSTDEEMSRIPFVLTYHPLNSQVQRILLHNFKVIANDPATSLIFPRPPMVGFRRDDNLPTSLVHVAEKQAATRAGTYPCQHPCCCTCVFPAKLIFWDQRIA